MKILPWVAAAFIFLSAQAQACGFITSAIPKVGSTVSGPVKQVTLTFTEKVFPASSTIAVLGMDGRNYATGKAYMPEKADNRAATQVAMLPPGKYKVQWHVLCECGSMMPGSYKFTVQ